MNEHAAALWLVRRTDFDLETALFRTRWLLVPFYAGLTVAMLDGYDNLISKTDLRHCEDRPTWMGNVGLSDLKQ